jgi:alanyl-tRNA synthetase
VADRLYYTDSHLTMFDARVVERGDLDGRPFVVLDRSAFYPTTGGQPHDTGTLGGRRVVEVIDREADGAVVHVLDASLAPGLVDVSGVIDWTRRFDHMQQHTGQHVLSAAFIRTCGVPTVSFHLGTDLSTIDLDGALDADAIRAAEEAANQAVWEDRPVSVRFVSTAEAAALPLRKEPVRGGMLRIVEVEGVDLSACGGTHVTRTGAIGCIAVQAWERYKGGTRVTFVCGGRALRRFRAARDQVAGAVRVLSIQPGELPDALSRLQGELRDARQQVKALGEQVSGFEAESLAREAEQAGGARILCRVIDRDAAGLKSLAQALVARPGHFVALAGAARPVVLVVARSADVPADAGRIVKALIERFGGRGGGRPEAAQAGGLDAAPDAVVAAAGELIKGIGE